ncbi:MAG: hypothetical protein ACYTGN_00250 [Planctomycetota bacterium]
MSDPDPTGPVTPALRAAAEEYRERWNEALFGGQDSPDIVCNHLTEPHGDFMGNARKLYCTELTATVAALVAEIALKHGAQLG